MLNNTNRKVEQRVMANVGAIYTVRSLTGTTALKLYTLILSIWAIGRFAWVARVFDNFTVVEKSGFGSTANFAVYALEHAHLGVQVALVVAALALAMLARDIVRALPDRHQQFSF